MTCVRLLLNTVDVLFVCCAVFVQISRTRLRRVRRRRHRRPDAGLDARMSRAGCYAGTPR